VTQGVSPLAFPQYWDYIYIAGVRSPGLAEVGECKRKNAWDKKRGKGAQGAGITYQGFEPATFDVKFTLWRYPGVTDGGRFTDPDDFQEWLNFVPLLAYDPTKGTSAAAQAVDIYHPSLAGIVPPISAVVVEELGNVVKKGPTLYEVSVKFLEYAPVPATNATSTPSGATANAPDPGKTETTTPDPTPEELLKSLKKQAEQH
jgi:hypothetical protein